MTDFAVAPQSQVVLPVQGAQAVFPVGRVFCVGKNYAEHVKEMGGDPTKSSPVIFMKPASAVAPEAKTVPYPPLTENLHYEAELVAALKSGGRDITEKEALGHVFGFAVGNDLTRRDRQADAKTKGQPWELAKAFDFSAPVSAIVPADLWTLGGQAIRLSVNGTLRQNSSLDKMIWSLPQIIAALSRAFELKAGDLIFTGTPDGVGPVVKGDVMLVDIDGLPKLETKIS